MWSSFAVCLALFHNALRPPRQPDILAYKLCKFSRRVHSLASQVCPPPLPVPTYSLLFESLAHSHRHLVRLFAMAAMQRRCCVLICSGDESPRIRCIGLWDVQLSSTTTLNWCLFSFYDIVHFDYPHVLLHLCPTQVWSPPSLPPSLRVWRENLLTLKPHPHLPDHQPAVFSKKLIEWQEGGQHEMFWVFFSPRLMRQLWRCFCCFFSFWSHPLIQLCHLPPLSILPSVTPDNRTTTTIVDHVPPLCTSLLPLTSFVFTIPQWSFLRHISYVSIHLSMELSEYRYKILMSIKSLIIFTKKTPYVLTS